MALKGLREEKKKKNRMEKSKLDLKIGEIAELKKYYARYFKCRNICGQKLSWGK